MLRIIITIPLLIPVAPAVAAGMSEMGDISAEHKLCINNAVRDHSPVDGQDAINKAIDTAGNSEREHCKDSCYIESERFYQSSSLHVTSKAPVFFGLASTRSQHQGVISFFPAADHFPVNYNYQPPFRPPI